MFVFFTEKQIITYIFQYCELTHLYFGALKVTHKIAAYCEPHKAECCVVLMEKFMDHIATLVSLKKKYRV